MTLAFEDKLCTLLSISSLAVISLSFLTHFDNSHFSVNFSMMSMISNLLPYMLGCCCLVAKLRLPLLWPRGLQSSRFLCSWNFPGENTGVGCYFFPGNLPGVRPASLALRQMLYCWATRKAHIPAYYELISLILLRFSSPCLCFLLVGLTKSQCPRY